MPTDSVKAKTRALHATLKRRAGTEPCMSLEDLRAEYAEMRFCAYCKAKLSEKNVSLDHTVPVSRGGGHGWSNLNFVCRSCNSAKGNLTGDEFATLLHYLEAAGVVCRSLTLRDYVVTQLKIASSFRIGAQRRAKK